MGGIEKDGNGVMLLDTSVSLEQTWRHMEAAVDAGKARSIGVRLATALSVRCCCWVPDATPYEGRGIRLVGTALAITNHIMRRLSLATAISRRRIKEFRLSEAAQCPRLG